MFLSECCPDRNVHLILRGVLGPSMSEYLEKRIRATSAIIIHEHAAIEQVNGDSHIESIDVCGKEGTTQNIPLSAIFVFIGSEPSHTWLPNQIERDDKGFVKAGIDSLNSGKWPLKDRDPCPLETTMPNVLVAGDIRSGSTKRVGFAVGDGSQAVTCVHSLLSS